jgi:hypothetical protein
MDNNILSNGIEQLGIIKSKLIELNTLNEEQITLEIAEKRKGIEIEKKEQKIFKEIRNVISQRRLEIEYRMNEQIENIENKIKDVRVNKEKTKKKAIVERIDNETVDYRSEEEELYIGGKSIFTKENIPFLYNNRLFFALYFPKGIVDVGIIIMTTFIAFFVLPLLFYYGFFAGMNVIYLALCNFVGIVFFGGLYLWLGKIKYKHIEALNRVSDMRQLIIDNKKNQRKIKKSIKNDVDESIYGLEEFDKEISSLEMTLSNLLEQKEKALLDFDSITAQDIKSQINSKYEQELQAMKSEYSKIYQQNKEQLEVINKLAIEISSNYEVYLGNALLTVEKIEQLEEIINSDQAGTIAEAIEVINQSVR